jgi:hypothetical protein
MSRIRLLHWKEEECAPRAAAISALGYEVDSTQLQSSSMKEFREDPPAAVVIDLSRLPSHGREVGVFLRGSKSTRLIPLVFVEGAPEKVAATKEALPDARYTTYAKLGPVLEDVLANPPKEAYVPKAKEPAPLGKKLGLKEGLPVGLVNAPKGFEALIPNAKRNPKAKVYLTLWFVETRRAFEEALPQMRQKAEDGGIWIIWPKTTKEAKPDINGNIVRETALSAGLVDFKICAVDDVWSGMRFAVKR